MANCLPARQSPPPRSCNRPPANLSPPPAFPLPSQGRSYASCKSRGGGGEQGLDQIIKYKNMLEDVPLSQRGRILRPRQHCHGTALLRPTRSVSSASVLRLPAAVLLRPPRACSCVQGERWESSIRNLKAQTRSKRTYLGVPRGRTTIHPSSASGLPTPSHRSSIKVSKYHIIITCLDV